MKPSEALANVGVLRARRLRTKGVLARFADHRALLDAIHALRGAGYTRLDAITPYEVEEVEHALDLPRSRIPFLAGGLAALCGSLALLLLWWTNAFDYRIDVGGRPYFSFWTDIPITYETMILTCGLTAFFAFFAASGMPRLHHPWFEIEGTEDGFWVAVDTSDPAYDARLDDQLREIGALQIETWEERVR